MANVLKQEKQEQVIKCLIEGSSIRSTERLTGVHRDTIMRLMVRAGNGSKKLMDEKLQNLNLSHIQMDEIWGANFGQIVKSYEAEPIGTGRYSPPKVVSVERTKVFGELDVNKISTSIVERQNLTMRMNIRRLTRLTNAFSKKAENHSAAIALWFGYYNFVRPHRSLKTTPAVMAGVEKRPWKMHEFLGYALAN